MGLPVSVSPWTLFGHHPAQRMGSNIMMRDLDAPAPQCGNPDGNELDYNMPFHIGALFIILGFSFIACAFPILAIRFPRLRIPPTFLFLARHFGTGVLLATAFVHLLPTAFISLTDECLGEFFTKQYPALAGAISLAAVFLVAIVEMVFSRGQHCCSAPLPEIECAIVAEVPVEQPIVANQIATSYGIGPHGSNSNSTARGLERLVSPANTPEDKKPATPEIGLQNIASDFSSDPIAMELDQARKKGLLQCMLLEMGILFHSIFIGIAISVAVGREFVVLLIAISFHQTFEGLALGSRIAALQWDKKALMPWLMALAYGLTTPLGQAIGLILHQSYDPASMTGLLVVGIMNAISSGLLIFASLVELMAEDFLSDESWKTLRGRRRVGACLVVFLGALGMSTVGAWA